VNIVLVGDLKILVEKVAGSIPDEVPGAPVSHFFASGIDFR
jgi:hypothetical protein